jgi:ABC-type antimicrobial peptide transport system permease subunit
VALHRGLGLLLLAIVVGLVFGSLLGELLAQFTTSSWLKDALTRGPMLGLSPPATLDLRLLSVTFGILFKVNVVGVLGIIVALIVVRRF